MGDEGVREQFLHYCPCPISPNLCLSHHHWCYRHHHIADVWRMLPHHSHHRCCHNLVAAAAPAAAAATAAVSTTATAPAAFTATFNNQTFMIFFPLEGSLTSLRAICDILCPCSFHSVTGKHRRSHGKSMKMCSLRYFRCAICVTSGAIKQTKLFKLK